MFANQTKLHLLAGKICAGKSTLAATLGRLPQTLVVSEDRWLSGLYGEEMTNIRDYVRYSSRLRTVLEPHLVSLLQSGLSVVLDFPANTVANRAWMRGIIDQADCLHTLHFLDVDDDICKARLRERNAGGEHEFAATDAQFDEISSHFEAPTAAERFNIVTVGKEAL